MRPKVLLRNFCPRVLLLYFSLKDSSRKFCRKVASKNFNPKSLVRDFCPRVLPTDFSSKDFPRNPEVLPKDFCSRDFSLRIFILKGIFVTGFCPRISARRFYQFRSEVLFGNFCPQVRTWISGSKSLPKNFYSLVLAKK